MPPFFSIILSVSLIVKFFINIKKWLAYAILKVVTCHSLGGCRSTPLSSTLQNDEILFADRRLTYFVQKNPVRTVVVIEIKLYCDRKKLKTPSKGCLFYLYPQEPDTACRCTAFFTS